jgi:hypothetical protein
MCRCGVCAKRHLTPVVQNIQSARSFIGEPRDKATKKQLAEHFHVRHTADNVGIIAPNYKRCSLIVLAL